MISWCILVCYTIPILTVEAAHDKPASDCGSRHMRVALLQEVDPKELVSKCSVQLNELKEKVRLDI